MQRLSEYTVAFAVIEYSDGTGSKKRPTVIVRLNDEEITFFKITSQYWDKSEYIQSRYYKIQDWKNANLDKESWVDTITPVKVSVDEIRFEITGHFTKRDINGLRYFLQNIQD